MRTATRAKVDTALRDEWLRTTEALQAQIASWVQQESGWTFKETETKEVEDALLGNYPAVIWSILTTEGEVRLEPMQVDFLGRRFVELYAWPTLRRVHLLYSPEMGGWRVRTDSGIFLRQPWNRESFVLLVQDLVEAE